MKNPRRLLHATKSELESALLSEGRAYRPPSTVRNHTLTALGIAGSSAFLAKTSAASVTTFWTLKNLVIGGAMVGLVAVGSVVIVQSGMTPTSSVGVPQPADTPAAPDEQVPNNTRSNTEEASDEDVPSSPPEEEAMPEPAERAKAATVSRRRATERSTSITDELQSLDAARTALARGDGPRALALLEEHRKRFPNSQLYLEAEVLRIEALARSGDHARAKTRAEAFVRRYPNSVFTRRIRRFTKQ